MGESDCDCRGAGCPVCAAGRREAWAAAVAAALGCPVADIAHVGREGAVTAFVRQDSTLNVTEVGGIEFDSDGARRRLSYQWTARRGPDAADMAHRLARRLDEEGA